MASLFTIYGVIILTLLCVTVNSVPTNEAGSRIKTDDERHTRSAPHMCIACIKKPECLDNGNVYHLGHSYIKGCKKYECKAIKENGVFKGRLVLVKDACRVNGKCYVEKDFQIRGVRFHCVPRMDKYGRLLKTKISRVVFQIACEDVAGSEDVKVEKFYEEIEKVKGYPKSKDTKIIMGDFNAKVGDGRVEDVVGPSGIVTVNERGSWLIEWCQINDFTITKKYGIKTTLDDSGRGRAPEIEEETKQITSSLRNDSEMPSKYRNHCRESNVIRPYSG
ncbi:craniofacial development protein 2-like [Plakobranchus ocellatus]|uniref:Craniofacial development protein 2-like n=1 Tax=Plakobranchus ocellatus TaxID=259542 RepID=A0AAV4BDN0_9GAST|nr:craniofacial development protein 2-like [Plakobranchus ocellatus]